MRELLTTETLIAFALLNVLLFAIHRRFRRGEPWQFTLGYHGFGLFVWAAVLGQQAAPSGWNAIRPGGSGEPNPWVAVIVATSLIGVITHFTSGKRPS